MTWDELREKFPKNWLLVEAIDAHTEGSQHIVNQLSLVDVFGDDGWAAWHRYVELHKVDSEREYYVLHTDRTELNIGIMDAFGLRPVE